MSGLENMRKRLLYGGGVDQQARMNADKLRSLKKALLYSYQAATAIMPDEREFRCLINPNKISTELDNKIISMPYQEVCLNDETSTEEVDTNISVGTVIEWKENKSHWLVFLQRDEETAYFRAELRRCRYQVEVGKNKYWIYLRGPVEASIQWAQARGDYYNKLNYSAYMYIESNEETRAFFHRFTKVKIADKPWEVQSVDSLTIEGVLEIYLKETNTNALEEEQAAAAALIEEEVNEYIEGKAKVKPYDIEVYTLKNVAGGGNWSLSNSKGTILETGSDFVKIQIVTSRAGELVLTYKKDDVTLEFPIVIESL